MLHVILTIQGGNVQQTIANSENILVTVIDYDNPSIATGKADSIVTPEGIADIIAREQQEIKNLQQEN